jgi:hypothetical protein
MLRFTSPQLCRTADASRLVGQLAASDASQHGKSRVSYFYGYWFSHWRA